MDTVEKKSKPKSREYPAVTLGGALEFVEKLKDYIPHKQIAYQAAADACGVKITTNSFKYTLSAAKQYGLIATSAGKTITFLDPAKRLVRPSEDADTLRVLKHECFRTPKLNSELISRLNGESVPSLQSLENTLVNNYGILPAVARVAASTFLDTAQEVGAIQNGILDLTIGPTNDKNATGDSEEEKNALPPVTGQTGDEPLSPNGEFAAPLNISFGDERRAILYMPKGASQEDALYVKDMISLMFKRVYGVAEDK